MIFERQLFLVVVFHVSQRSYVLLFLLIPLLGELISDIHAFLFFFYLAKVPLSRCVVMIFEVQSFPAAASLISQRSSVPLFLAILGLGRLSSHPYTHTLFSFYFFYLPKSSVKAMRCSDSRSAIFFLAVVFPVSQMS